LNSRFCLKPPFLVFPDQAGGFFLFQEPQAVFEGPQLAVAEALAHEVSGWLAGGLQYARAESPAPGWWGVFSHPRVVSHEELLSLTDPSPVRTGPLKGTISPLTYAQAFEQVHTALAQGITYQVNLTFGLEGNAVSGSPWSWRSALRLWLDLIAAQGREASFAVLGGATSPGPVLVSASPELFFQQEGTLIDARPMKGTALRSPDPSVDAALRHQLFSSAKTRAENLMITDMLRNDLGRLAVPGGVTVPRLFDLEPYPTVWQMTSTVRAQLPAESTLSALMAALFPCASITGAPKLSTQAVIEKVEAHCRGWYTGTLGWHRPGSSLVGPSRSRFSVLIRTLVFDHPDRGAFRLGVGGGVVWDSTSVDEYAEAWAKSRFLGSTRREFSLTEAVLWEPEGGFFLLEEHLARLSAACRDFGGTVPAELNRALADEVARLLANGLSGPFKLRVLVDPDFTLRIEGEALSPMPEVLTAALAPRPLGEETLLWRRYKTSDRRVYDELRVPGADQTLHFNAQGELTESTSMNLVLETKGQFLTPPLDCGLLAGTYRDSLVKTGQIVEAVLPVSALQEADRVWLINSVRRWKPVRLVESKELP